VDEFADYVHDAFSFTASEARLLMEWLDGGPGAAYLIQGFLRDKLLAEYGVAAEEWRADQISTERMWNRPQPESNVDEATGIRKTGEI
jgi:hypothetical protein